MFNKTTFFRETFEVIYEMETFYSHKNLSSMINIERNG